MKVHSLAGNQCKENVYLKLFSLEVVLQAVEQ